MKKFLLYFWNLFFDLKARFINGAFECKDLLFRRFYKTPAVMTVGETVEYILKTNCSVSRYGDAEIRLAAGVDVYYQDANAEVQNRLRQVLNSNEPGLLVCLPTSFGSLAHMTDGTRKYWKNHMARYRKVWCRYIRKGQVYGNAFISRNYMCFNEKESARAYFDSLKRIWDKRDIVFIEGEKSRLGVGNDLFDNGRSIRRILGPSAYAFEKYGLLLEEAKKLEKTCLILLAMGPAATVMPYDLQKLGYQAIDIGHVDIEYEWFLKGATEKQPVANKMVYEAGAGEGVGGLDDEKYLSQIIAKVL